MVHVEDVAGALDLLPVAEAFLAILQACAKRPELKELVLKELGSASDGTHESEAEVTSSVAGSEGPAVLEAVELEVCRTFVHYGQPLDLDLKPGWATTPARFCSSASFGSLTTDASPGTMSEEESESEPEMESPQLWVSRVLQVPTNFIPHFIGRGGRHIKKLKAATGTDIQVLEGYWRSESTSVRVEGWKDAVDSTCEKINAEWGWDAW